MKSCSLSEPQQYAGHLKAGILIVPVVFRAHINPLGDLEFDFDRIYLTDYTFGLNDYFLQQGPHLSIFSLQGQADNGTELAIERIHFSSEHFLDTKNKYILLTQGRYQKAKITKTLSEVLQKPVIKNFLLGFKKSHRLEKECQLGVISMNEFAPTNESDDLTGYLRIEANGKFSDISDWYDNATKALEHVRLVMSFASGLMLQNKIIEFYAMDKLEVDLLSPILTNSNAAFPVFESYDRQKIFSVAVDSFFSAPYSVKNLFIAIEWFVMNSNYAEVRLVNAMTVLENLISSNFDENQLKIIPNKKVFDNCRRQLRQVIKSGFQRWLVEEGESHNATLSDINENLESLNRRSLRQKIYILANCWSVPLEDIGEHQIKAVIKARNSIVHQGHCNDDQKKELWQYAMVARELVIRFIFGAIGFQGRYISHLGKYHNANYRNLDNVIK